VVDWPSYRRTMPECAAVICHAGHGTLAQALSAGVPVVCSPAGGDMGENAARAAWAGVGVSLPRRLATPRGVRLGLRRLLADSRPSRLAADMARTARESPGAPRAARLLEALVGDPYPSPPPLGDSPVSIP
jgi:UDP:flavonoid glycosyltransferase YjiC (YdhE family)